MLLLSLSVPYCEQLLFLMFNEIVSGTGSVPLQLRSACRAGSWYLVLLGWAEHGGTGHRLSPPQHHRAVQRAGCPGCSRGVCAPICIPWHPAPLSPNPGHLGEGCRCVGLMPWFAPRAHAVCAGHPQHSSLHVLGASRPCTNPWDHRGLAQGAGRVAALAPGPKP